MRQLAAAAAALALVGCAVRVPEETFSHCDAAASGAWTAQIQSYRTTEPVARTGRSLVVSGAVTVPSGGYRVWLEEGPLLDIEPRTQQILVRTDPPDEGATMAIVPHRLTGAFRARKKVGEVVIRCGDGIIAVVPVTPLPS